MKDFPAIMGRLCSADLITIINEIEWEGFSGTTRLYKELFKIEHANYQALKDWMYCYIGDMPEDLRLGLTGEKILAFTKTTKKYFPEYFLLDDLEDDCLGLIETLIQDNKSLFLVYLLDRLDLLKPFKIPKPILDNLKSKEYKKYLMERDWKVKRPEWIEEFL